MPGQPGCVDRDNVEKKGESASKSGKSRRCGEPNKMDVLIQKKKPLNSKITLENNETRSDNVNMVMAV